MTTFDWLIIMTDQYGGNQLVLQFVLFNFPMFISKNEEIIYTLCLPWEALIEAADILGVWVELPLFVCVILKLFTFLVAL